MRYRFGELELDPDAYVLRRAGVEVTLQPKMFELLRHLIERRERVVTKEELLDALWPGEHVNDSAVAWTVSHVRTALGQERGERLPIETIHGRGYRFRASVDLIDADGTTTTSSVSLPPSAIAAVGSTGANTGANTGTSASLRKPPQLNAEAQRPFVGRSDVMHRLHTLLANAQSGRGCIALLCGEAGIGKTRCAEELMQSAASAKVAAWLGRAVEDAGAPMFWPWIQIVRKVAVDRPTLREAAEKILEQLAAFEGQPAEPTDTRERNANEGARERSATTGRFLLMDAVTRLLVRATESEPAVLLLDDLQWADSGTLDLLAFLAPELGSSRIFVLATHRGIQAADTRMTRVLRHAERFDLAHLTPEDIGQYVAALTDVQQTPDALAQALHRATSGNPLFMQETVRELLADHGDAFATLDTLDIGPPEIAHDVLRVRLERLAPATFKLLTTAAVLGETFDLAMLQTVSEAPQNELLEHLQEGAIRGFVVYETPQRARFIHALIRHVLYDAMSASERMRIHRRAALALEALPSIERRNGEIASHYYRSLPLGDYARASHAAERAAYEAKAVFAFDEAARFYSWALEAQALDPEVAPRARAELLLATGATQRHSGRDMDARHTLSRMFDISREHGYADLIVRGARSLRPTVAMAMVPDPTVRGPLEDVLQMKPEAPAESRAMALSLLAYTPPYAHDLVRSKEMSGNALKLAREAGNENAVLEAMRARLFSLSGPDDIDELLATSIEMLAMGERATSPSIEAYSARVGAFIYRGDMPSADEALAKLNEVAQSIRLPEMMWYCDRLLLQRKLLDGDYASAQAAMPGLRRRSKRMGLSYGPFFVDVLERRMAVERKSAAVALAGVDLSAARDVKNMNPSARARMTRVAADLGQLDIARASLDSFAAHGFASIPKEISYLSTLACLGGTAVVLGDTARAEQLYALLLPYAHFNTPDLMMLYDGSASRFLAALAIFLGRTDQIERHFEDALAMNERIGQKPAVAVTQYQYAHWLRTQSAPGAQARSHDLAQSALELAERLGIAYLADRARSLT